MVATYECPHCGKACFDQGDVIKRYWISHGTNDYLKMEDDDAKRSSVQLTFGLCPNCKKVAIHMIPSWKNEAMKFAFSYPPSSNTIFLPDYIPEAIRADYLESVAIADLSPKASATLARRCLQGMIHDFWGIVEKNLNAEITALKPHVPAAQWAAIDGLRKIGNIGAHMEKDVELIIDVDPDEAKKLLKLIELLFEKWYIARHDEEQLLEDIKDMADEKEAERHSVPSGQ